MGAMTALYLGWMKWRWGGSTPTLWVDDAGQVLAAWWAAYLCLRRARRGDDHSGTFWKLMGASAFAWGVGEVVWCYYELGLGHAIPFPSLADVGFLAAVPLAIAGLMFFPGTRPRSWLRVRAILDGALVASALLFVSWGTVLGPVYRNNHDGLLKSVLSLSYPLSDIVIAAVVIGAAARAPRRARTVLVLVALGMLALGLADSSFAYFTTVNTYGIGNVIDTGWIVGYLLIALGALWPASLDGGTTGVERPGRINSLLAYVPVLGALGVAIAVLASARPFGLVLTGDGIALVLLLCARQIVTAWENVSLNERLTAKVEFSGLELVRQDARFVALARRSSDLITIVSAAGVIEYQSPSCQQLLGVTPEELIGTSFPALLHPEEREDWTHALVQVALHPARDAVAEWQLRTRIGSYIAIESRITNLLHDPAVGGIVLNGRDVSERKQLEEELRHEAFHDPLTGLANRSLFRDRLEHALARSQRGECALGVLFLDLDDFKAVNDGRGHAAGDELLRAVGDRLRGSVRIGDTVARMGGDEFAVLVEDVLLGSVPEETADRLLDAFEAPFMVAGGETYVHASIGVATTASGHDTVGELLRDADVAMYAAKKAGKGRRETFHRDLHDQVIRRLELEADLGRAIENDEFVVYYQPIVDLHSEVVVGFEALMRWNHPTRGLVLPGEFIPAAEAIGHILPMGRSLLHRACADASAVQHEAARPELKLSVNLSTRQLEDPTIVNEVAHALAGADLEPSLLTLEITESIFMTDSDRCLGTLESLKALGVKLSIDDFGTGYSSLSYLQRLPIDELKIDQSFVAASVAGNPEAIALLRNIVRLASDLGLSTLAEGIETVDQLRLLQRAGCRYGQGYFFARPMDRQRLLQHLAGMAPALAVTAT